jgi:hypothetical protein
VSKPDPNSIDIRFSIRIPAGIAAHVAPAAQRPSWIRPMIFAAPTYDFNPGDPKQVRTVSDSALGFICTKVTFSAAVSNVAARVYVDTDILLGGAQDPPPGKHTNGATTDNMVWYFDDAHGTALPEANHSPGAVPVNMLVVWWQPDTTSTDYAHDTRNFRGQTGTSGYCGTGSGSGPGAIFVAAGAATFPAVWCVEMSGFTGPEAAFNNSFTLRSHRAAAAQVWENQADGETSPRLELHHAPHAQEWTLHVRLGGHRFTSHARSHSAFGPLFFPAGAAAGGAAAAGGPRIIAFPL